MKRGSTRHTFQNRCELTFTFAQAGSFGARRGRIVANRGIKTGDGPYGPPPFSVSMATRALRRGSGRAPCERGHRKRRREPPRMAAAAVTIQVSRPPETARTTDAMPCDPRQKNLTMTAQRAGAVGAADASAAEIKVRTPVAMDTAAERMVHMPPSSCMPKTSTVVPAAASELPMVTKPSTRANTATRTWMRLNTFSSFLFCDMRDSHRRGIQKGDPQICEPPVTIPVLPGITPAHAKRSGERAVGYRRGRYSARAIACSKSRVPRKTSCL